MFEVTKRSITYGKTEVGPDSTQEPIDVFYMRAFC